MAKPPDNVPRWLKNRRTAAMNVIKRRMKYDIPPYEQADAFLDDLHDRVLKAVDGDPTPDPYSGESPLDHLREYYDVDTVEVDVRGVNSTGSMARGELLARVEYVFNDGQRIAYTIGYRRGTKQAIA